ncbi:hypothetical protein ASD65_13920 [Microbacterium sp. Root61]|uniref:class I adenylate-forming enzyme family protein n=1 Tax=Microbacterium sp. Root61 TaxID=1736570 RepID=UPI0006F67605|nr:AMP-binding protein [Microbacterium sp. Root61]KRA25398.1 hypothetical protein ASD65_13920 [Microbacterium sp. Root61]
MYVHDVLARAAADHSDALAVEGPDGSLSFAELWARAEGLAAHLQSTGLRPGDVVLEALPNSAALLVSDFALSLAGLVRVPLNPRLGLREWRAIAADSGARALIGTAIDPTGVDVPLIEMAAAPAAPPVGFRPTPSEIAGLAYSSGTTGLPKGAVRTHRMRLASAAAMRDSVIGAGITDDADAAASVYLHAGPAIHTSGLFVLPMLALGVPQLMLDHARPAQIIDTIRTRRVSHLAVVPTVLSALAAVDGVSRADFASVRMLAYAGSPIPPAQLALAYERLTPALVQYYGLVEAMPPLSVLSAADHAAGLAAHPELLRSAGRIVPSVQMRSEDGEILVRGDAVTPGYRNAETRTDLGKSVRDGWLHTGDVGRIDGDRLWLTDRRSDMIISGGYNIYPSELDVVAAAVPGVDGCAAVGLPDPVWGQRLELAYSGDAAVDDIAAAFGDLPRHKQPKAITRLDALPLGATGKIDRRAVAVLLAERAEARPVESA